MHNVISSGALVHSSEKWIGNGRKMHQNEEVERQAMKKVCRNGGEKKSVERTTEENIKQSWNILKNLFIKSEYFYLVQYRKRRILIQHGQSASRWGAI